MAVRVEVPPSHVNTEITLPITIGVGDVINTVGTVTLEVRGGQVEDIRPLLAAALREAAAAVERVDPDEDDQEVPDAAAHG